VADAERLDPALLAEGEGDEVAQLDDLVVAEVLAQACEDGLVSTRGRPDEVARVGERRLLALVVAIRPLELEEVDVVLFG
jgi:hypothetical protein